MVNQTPGARVLDLGCGTGRLALGLSAAGHTVTGVDPAGQSLAAAKSKPGAGQVTWIEGTSADLPEAAFDVAVMTSHVAQFFVTAESWQRTLTDLKRALVPGGRLTFDSRDPRAQKWLDWNPVDSRHQITLPDGAKVTAWTEVTQVKDRVVDFTIHYLMPPADELTSEELTSQELTSQELTSEGTLAFRTEDEVRSSLTEAGFTIEHIYGGWNRDPIGSPDGEFLVIATA